MRSSRDRRIASGGACRGVALLIAASLGGLSGHARPVLAGPPSQATANEYEVKAVFIYHFTRYLQWPRSEASDGFEIAILGKSAIVPPLLAIAAKRTIHENPIAVRLVSDVESLGQPQVLFVARPAAPHLAQVLERTRGKAILTVAEEEGLAAEGIAVNFVAAGDTIRFEINQNTLRESGIQPSSQLLKLAILVGDHE
jgi:hypothetical protein